MAEKRTCKTPGKNIDAIAAAMEVKAKENRKRLFESAEDFMDYWEAFLDHLKKDGYSVPPTSSEFARWCGVSKRTVNNYIANYNLREKVAPLTADCYVEGAMAKSYQTSMTIFALKNTCGWSDKREVSSIAGEKKIATKEEAKRNILELAADLQ